MQEQYGLEVTINPNGVSATFDEDVRILLFQSVRELLFNVVKHAGTLRAEVSMSEMDGLVHITVNDDGKGFDGVAIMKDGIRGRSLLRMRDRLALLGCDLTVQSEQDNGAKITIEAPIKGTID
jgi:signal transduction histidine kinase